MTLQNITGTWRLIASGSINSEIAFINDEYPDPNGVSNWLNEVDESPLIDAKATSGLTLSIDADGGFSERVSGKPEVYWFDDEGVLQAEVTPFDGVVLQSGQAFYMQPVNIARWAAPVPGRYGMAVLRYDHGDTKISDSLRVKNDQLIRTVNVVTDELYLDRVVIVYERAA